MPGKLTNKEFVDKIEELHPNKYTILSQYNGGKYLIKVKYNDCGHIKDVLPRNLRLGYGCKTCQLLTLKKKNTKYPKTKKVKHGINLKWTPESFAKYVEETTDNEYKLIDHTTRITTTDKVAIEHVVCNNIFFMTPSHFEQGNRCPKCAKTGIKVTIRSQNFTKWLQNECGDEYTVSNYYNDHSNATFTHHLKNGKKHDFSIYPHNFKLGQRCTICGTISRGEQAIRRYLESKHINFIAQKKFAKCKYKKQLPFDFYLPDYNLCIEFDGEQHYHPVDFSGHLTEAETLKQFKLNQKRDNIKNAFCKNNSIDLLRISYQTKLSDIDKVLDKKLFQK